MAKRTTTTMALGGDAWAPLDMATVMTLTDAELFSARGDEDQGEDCAGIKEEPPTQPQVEEAPAPEQAAQDDHARDDVLLLRLGLRTRPYMRSVRSRRAAWGAIARAFATASGGTGGVACGGDVTSRLGVLTLMLYERAQRLPLTLRLWILRFHELNHEAGYATWLGAAFLETLRRNATQAAPALPTTTTGAPHRYYVVPAEPQRRGRAVVPPPVGAALWECSLNIRSHASSDEQLAAQRHG